ncbi:MAG: ABC transporter permease [Bryobacteraceae bacterium]
MNWKDLLLRLRAIFFRQKMEEDLADELAFHIEMQTRKNMAQGMSPAEASRAARAQFGRTTAIEEECRDERRINLIETVWQDIRYAFRSFQKTPTFTLTVIATIGLGLGVNAAVFTIFNAYVLRPLAVRDPYSLYIYGYRDRAGKQHGFTWRQYEQLQSANARVFAEVYGVIHMPVRVGGRQCFAELVTGNYFGMLGVNAKLGRTLTPEDSATPGQSPVMVLSSAAWRGQFASDPDIIGRKILVRGYPIEVVGVAQDGFGGLGDFSRDFWIPLTMAPLLLPTGDPFAKSEPEWIDVIVRVKPGVTESQAKSLLTATLGLIKPNAKPSEQAAAVTLESRATSVHLGYQGMLVVMPIVTAFGLILLLACANVANMMLARAMARQREIGIRLSLGAARRRLIRQLLTESIVLALPGAVVGFLISRVVLSGGVRLIVASLPSEFTEFFHVAPLDADPRVFGFMLLAALASGLLFGLAPAIQATRVDFGRAYRPQGLRNALVVFQVAISSLLLVCAGILLGGANRVHSLDTGLRTNDVIWIQLTEKWRERALTELERQPSIHTLAVTSNVPFDAGFPSLRLTAGDKMLDVSSYDFVSPEFFDVFGISIRRGRDFTSGEAQSDVPVAIVSETVARRLWPGRDPIGQSVHMEPDLRSYLGRRTPMRYPNVEVIGVASDVNTGLVEDQASRSLVYFPATHRRADTKLVVRVNGDTETARQAIDRALALAAPGAIDRIHKMQEHLAGRIYPFRITSWISMFLGTLALALTITGVYGVIAYLVQQRTKEMGIRKALGATSVSMVTMVMKQSLRLAVTGIGIGGVISLGVSRFLAAELVVVEGVDPAALGFGTAIVLTACLLASLFPSLKAARVDAMTTLRHD